MKQIFLAIFVLFLSYGAFAHSYSASDECSNVFYKKYPSQNLKNNFKVLNDICLEYELYLGNCPDGSSPVLIFSVILTDCESGLPYGNFNYYFDQDLNEGCI